MLDPTVVGDQILHIQHDLCIALVCVGCDGLQTLAMILVDDGGLGVQDERNSQETLLRLLALRNIRSEIPPGRNLEAYFDPFDLWRVSVSAALDMGCILGTCLPVDHGDVSTLRS